MSYRIQLTTTLISLTALGLAGCATPPADLDLSLKKASSAGAYQVALIPPTKTPAINQIHSWTVQVSDTTGNPVHDAVFTVGGGMPQHGHGLPTKPRVSNEFESGSYRIDGMKFSMPGWWEIKLDIRGTHGADTVTFNTVVVSPPKA